MKEPINNNCRIKCRRNSEPPFFQILPIIGKCYFSLFISIHQVHTKSTNHKKQIDSVTEKRHEFSQINSSNGVGRISIKSPGMYPQYAQNSYCSKSVYNLYSQPTCLIVLRTDVPDFFH